MSHEFCQTLGAAPTRREFLGSAAIAAGLALAPGALASSLRAAPRPAPLEILILGGTNFLGPAVVDAATARGHTLTLFNRGMTEKKKVPAVGKDAQVERLYGNRDPEKHADDADSNSPKGLESLRGRSWAAVIDTSGFYPRIVKASAEFLAPNVKHYTFISSISAYKNNNEMNKDESDVLATMADPTVEDMGADFGNYGPLKVLCEQAAEAAMPGRVANVRPGFIVGPGDGSDRFTHWPLRIADGGEVLCGGSASDPVQFIDVRDLGAWLVKVAEEGATGAFNATGPTGPEKPYTWGEFLGACKQSAGGQCADATLTWVNAEFIQARPEPIDLTIWVPAAGETAGFHTRNCGKAIKAGMSFRSVDETIRDTMAWFRGLPPERQGKPRAGISREAEAAVLKAWHESESSKSQPSR